MKDLIEYYYNLVIDKLFIEDDKYHFILNNHDFYFVYFSRTKEDLEDILFVSNELKQKGINVHNIKLNINNSYLTKVDGIDYVLLEVFNKDEIIDIFSINNYNKKLSLNGIKSNLYRNNWAYLWSAKVDYIESQLNEIQYDKIIDNSIDYYIGLSENAIYYVNNVNSKYSMSSLDKIVLSRKRIISPNYSLNYFNPLSFIFDLEVRDIAEYIKSTFFDNGDAYLDLESYLKSTKLTIYSYNMLFARLLFPSYYFDIYEKVVNKDVSSEKLLKIINKANEYEIFLKKAYVLISTYAPLENIEWLKN